MNEQNIIKLCQKGETEKFGLIYDKYVKQLYNFIYYKTFHKETAEDILSQVFLKALNKINNYDPKIGSFSSWIYKIARNQIIDHYRTKKTNINIEDVWNIEDDSNISLDTENKIKLEKIKKYLSKYSVEQREIIMLKIWEGLSYKEISEVVGKSEASCKMMFSRTIDKLRKEMPLSIFIMLLLNL